MRRICETSIAPSATAYLQHTRKPQVYCMLYIHRFFVCFFTFRVGVFQKLLPHIAFSLAHWIEGKGAGKEKVESVVLNARACAAASCVSQSHRRGGINQTPPPQAASAAGADRRSVWLFSGPTDLPVRLFDLQACTATT